MPTVFYKRKFPKLASKMQVSFVNKAPGSIKHCKNGIKKNKLSKFAKILKIVVDKYFGVTIVCTVPLRKPNRVQLSDSILCQSDHSIAGPFETRTQKFGFRMVASLDRFIKKRVMNKIFFMLKRSRLAKMSGPKFF
jgi:hypothetical protein